MRKLTDAEMKFLNSIPDNERRIGQTVIGGTYFHGGQWPKGTKIRTVDNLFDLGLIEQAPTMIWDVPIRLSDAGRAAVGRKPRAELKLT